MSTVSISEFLWALFHGQLLHFQTLNFYSYRGILIAHQTFLVQLGTPGNYFMSRCKEFKQSIMAIVRQWFDRKFDGELRNNCYANVKIWLTWLLTSLYVVTRALYTFLPAYLRELAGQICRPCSVMEIEWLRLTAAKIIHGLPKNTMDCDIFQHVHLQSLGYIYKRRLAVDMFKAKHVQNRLS